MHGAARRTRSEHEYKRRASLQLVGAVITQYRGAKGDHGLPAQAIDDFKGGDIGQYYTYNSQALQATISA